MREHQEEWQKLCEQAAAEQDSQKLRNLVRRIDELLATKQERLNRDAASKKPKSSVARQGR